MDIKTKKQLLIIKKMDGRWASSSAGSSRINKYYSTKSAAIADTKKIKAIAIVHKADNDIAKVIIPRRGLKSSSIKRAQVKHRRSNQDVNIAIAKAIS
jgi:hypothetical protein